MVITMAYNKDLIFVDNYVKNIQKYIIEINKKKLIFLKEKILKKKNKNKIIVIGNGGSSSLASHFSVDMTKNAKIRTINFNETNLISCFSNDYGFENWIKKSVEYYCEKDDILIAISSSGKSKNIIKAAKFFKKNFGLVVTFTGMNINNPLKKTGDINFHVNSLSYNLIENIHQFYLLLLVDLIIGKVNYKSNL